MLELQNRLIENKHKTRASMRKSQRDKENAIRDKFRQAVTRYRCDENILQLQALPTEEIER